MIQSEQREGSGEHPDRGSSSSARLAPGEGDGDSGLRRPTPNRLRGKRVWKAYHERQVLLAKDRQRSRALCRESGDGHCRLPDVGGRTAGVTAIAAAWNEPSAVWFNREGVEFTADSLGANGCFIDIYHRCGHGNLKARAVGACGHAAGGREGRGRDREKDEQLKPNSPGPRTRLLRRGDAAAIESDSASGCGGIPEVKASVLRGGDGNCGDDGESICSVLSFENLYAKTTQVTDALATVERARESEPVKHLPPRWPRGAGSTLGVGSAGGLSETGGRGISASRWPVERKRPSVGVSGSAAEELEGSGIVAEDLSSISTTITDVAAASKGERSSQALESTVDSVVTTAAGNSSALDFTLGSVDSPSGIGSAVAGIGPATESVSKWTGSGSRGRPRRPNQRKGGIGLESSDWRRRGVPPATAQNQSRQQEAAVHEAGHPKIPFDRSVRMG